MRNTLKRLCENRAIVKARIKSMKESVEYKIGKHEFMFSYFLQEEGLISIEKHIGEVRAYIEKYEKGKA